MNWAARTSAGFFAAGALTLAGGCYSIIDSAGKMNDMRIQRPRQAGYERQIDNYISRQNYGLLAEILAFPLAASGVVFLIVGAGKRGDEEEREPQQLRLPFEYHWRRID
ncbi:MAG: hypothetical protein HY517_04005 [Candidatus Aenigmarchaeota archaeon]|nr:hypothetical protein [Candidatus Aenigmarchaeota archaeon]